MLFLRQVVLLTLLRRRWARHIRRLQASPTPRTALQRTTLRLHTAVIRKALLNTRRLLMLRRDHIHLVAAVARARPLRHIRLWIRTRMALRTPRIITRLAATARATRVLLITRLSRRPTLPTRVLLITRLSHRLTLPTRVLLTTHLSRRPTLHTHRPK